MLGLLVRVWQLQAKPEAAVVALRDTQASEATLLGRRGPLLDRRGRVLASSRVAYRLFVDPVLIADRGGFSERMYHLLGYPPEVVERALDRRAGSRYVVIDPRMSPSRVEALRRTPIRGVGLEPVLVRDYPQEALGGQVLGFVGSEGTGLAGLELAWERELAAEQGTYDLMRDSHRRAMWVRTQAYTPQRDGKPIRLSLDLTIQLIAERYLAETVTRYNAASGQLVVMQPETGEVLAMANYPTLDPNDFGSANPDLRRNRCVTDFFEPGSIFKPIAWAALTQLDAAGPGEVFDTGDTGVWRSSKGRRLRDTTGHGPLTWEEVLIESSNIGMAMAAQRTSDQRLRDAVLAFGFGEATGSHLPGEVAGLVTPPERWNHYSQTSVPMGQEIAVTPLQMVRGFAAIANDGLLPTPTIRAVGGPQPAEDSQRRKYFQDEFTSSGGVSPGVAPHRVTDPAPVLTRVVRPDVARLTREVLHRVVDEGTGRKAKSDRYQIFGKTGTAQLPDAVRGGYHQDRYVSSFIAGAPVDHPRIVVGMFIHDPDKSIGHYGGLVAAPAVKEVIEETLQYLGVPEKAVDPPGKPSL